MPMLLNPYRHGGFTVSISPSPNNQSRSGSGALSSAMTATPAGGTGPFTYNWTVVSSDGSTPGLTNATTATVTAALSNTAGEVTNFTLRCTVTDTATGGTNSADVNCTYTWI